MGHGDVPHDMNMSGQVGHGDVLDDMNTSGWGWAW